MTFKIRFESEAGQELMASAKWSELQSKGLGTRLVKNVYSTINYIQVNPQSFPIYQGSYRQAVIRNFPFVIVYKATEATITIVAVFHAARNPSGKIR